MRTDTANAPATAAQRPDGQVHVGAAGPAHSRITGSPAAPGGTPTRRVPVRLRRVYIVPTRNGLLFGATLAFLLLGSVNYNLGLGYVLTFLLGGLGVVAMLHTWRNLAGLELRPGPVQPVFAGEQARFQVLAVNTGRLARTAIGIARTRTATPSFVDVPATDAVLLTVTAATRRRGWMPLGRFTALTTQPLGLFRAWCDVELDQRCLVYPAPEPGNPPLPRAAASASGAGLHGAGAEDFAGLRQYRPGDSLRHVAWKAAAREAGLRTKEFTAPSGPTVWLDWALLPAGMPTEQRLARFVRWVLSADLAQVPYGMRLPGWETAPDAGPAHRGRCLERLATFGADGDTQ